MMRFLRFLPTVFFLVTAGQLSAESLKPSCPLNKPPCSFSRSNSFTGFQLGLVGGGSIGRTEIADPALVALAPNSVMAPTGFAAGLQLGYGAVMSGVFLGADVGTLKDWASDTCELQASELKGILSSMMTYKAAVKMRRDTPFYIAAKAGYPINNSLPYIRLGYANSTYHVTLDRWDEKTTTTGTTLTPVGTYKINDRRNSVIVSGGVDFLVTPCFVAGLNYDIIPNQSRKTFLYNDPDELTLKHNHHQVLLKLAYRM